MKIWNVGQNQLTRRIVASWSAGSFAIKSFTSGLSTNRNLTSVGLNWLGRNWMFTFFQWDGSLEILPIAWETICFAWKNVVEASIFLKIWLTFHVSLLQLDDEIQFFTYKTCKIKPEFTGVSLSEQILSETSLDTEPPTPVWIQRPPPSAQRLPLRQLLTGGRCSEVPFNR